MSTRPPPRERAPRVCVVGGGVTGLTLAYSLLRSRPDVHLTLLESRARLGGNIVTERRDGFVIDGGPDSFLRTKPHAVALCRELGLENELITTRPGGRKVYVAHEGALEAMPGGMALAVPTRVGPMLHTPLLSWRGKLRAAREPFIKARTDDADESIEQFITRRMGGDAARRIAGPLLGGIYAGDVTRLSVRATFPQLVAMEREHGSLVRGFFEMAKRARGANGHGGGLLGWLSRGEQEAPSPFCSLKGGMGTLIDALAGALPEGAVQTEHEVTQVAQVPGYEGRWIVESAAADPVVADAVAVTSPAHVAAKIIADAELSSELTKIPYLSTATVFMAFDADSVEHPLDAVGFIAPEGESRLLAATWVTSKWDHRAPEGRVLMRAFVGGARAPNQVRDSSDDDLVLLARSELTRLMGQLGTPLLTRVFRYPQSNPQPIVGHLDRLDRVRSRLASLPGLHLAGAAYDGVGIPDCIRQAQSLAESIIKTFPS